MKKIIVSILVLAVALSGSALALEKALERALENMPAWQSIS